MWKDESEGKSGKHEQARDAIDRKKKAFKLWCTNRSTESKNNYRKAKNETKKVTAKAMKLEAEEEMSVLCTKPHDVFKFVKFMKKEEETWKEEIA